MGAYPVFLAILAAWAFVALRDVRPLRPYGIIYGINAVVAVITEAVFAILLDCYTFGGFMGYFLVTLGIEPLLGVLYARYSHRRPILRAVVAAVILGGPVEWLFLWLGAFRYDRGWHPGLTMLFFTGYFLWTRWLRAFI